MSDENKSDCKVTKDEKCVFTKKLYSPTIRLSIPLDEPDEESCSVFNYKTLIAKEKRNREHQKEKEKEKVGINGSIEEDIGENDEAKRLAQYFEEKYGNSKKEDTKTQNPKKTKKKNAPFLFDITKWAEGYDDNDPFIDNSEAVEEVSPDKETFHGGYYVNCGRLEFKKVELGDDNSDFEETHVGKKKNCNVSSDDSECDDENSIKSDVEEMDLVDDEAESTLKKLPEEANHIETETLKSMVKASKANGDKLKCDKSKENVPNNVPKLNGELVKKIKKPKKRPHDVIMKDNDNLVDKLSKVMKKDDDAAAGDGSSKAKKKIITARVLLDEKRATENGETCVVFNKQPDMARNSINDIIESVVNAARNHSDDSRDSTCSSSDTKSIDSRTSYDTEKDSHHDEMEITETPAACAIPNIPKEQIKLPDNLPADVLELISQIKNSTQTSGFGGIRTLNPYINSKLLSLETKVRPLMSNTRQALYGHLANFMPCSKETLMKRAKNLLIEEEEKHMEEPFKKLKASIDKVMPTLASNYAIACQLVEEKNNELSKNADSEDKKISLLKLPHKKFVWSEETRSSLRDLVACRLNCFHLLKPRKETPEDYVKKFLKDKVKPLWPAGWMETSILWKESQANNTTTGKTKKSSSSSSNTAAGASSTKKSHPSVPNSNSTATAISAANYISNSMLQTLAMQYSQSEVGYPITTTASIPYRPDLSLLTPGMVPMSMDLLSQFALANYGKATSPPKKQSPSPGYSSQRSNTPHSSESKKCEKVSGDGSKSKHDSKKIHEAKKSEKISADSFTKFADMFNKDAKSNEAKKNDQKAYKAFLSHMLQMDGQKKSDKKSNDAFIQPSQDLSKVDPKFNDASKIDPLLNSSKSKKEHHMLNHISQYNKHYSHKIEKRKSAGHERKEKNTPTHSAGATPAPPPSKPSPCEVLDLSPSKVVKIDAKSETVAHRTPESHSKKEMNVKSETIVRRGTPEPHPRNETNLSICISANPSKDHTYWSSAATKEDLTEMREHTKHDKAPILPPLIPRPISTPETTITPVAQAVTPKPTHISRKQRILQESAKSAAQEVMKTCESVKSSTQDKSVAKVYQESTYSNESQSHHSVPKHLKDDDKLTSIKEEKKPVEEKQIIEETATATDILSKIINDTLQDNSTPLQPQFTNSLFENTRIKQEVKIEDVELQLNEYNMEKSSHPPSRESHTPVLDKSSPCSVNSERKTPSSDRAEMEAADVINDLLVLNQIGGHNPMRRTDYQDSRYIDNRHLNADMNFSNGSMLSQSSPHNSNNSKTSSIPRMSLTGFQDEFLQHIFKMDRDNSSYSGSSATPENCFSTDFPSLENNKSSFNHVSASSSVKPGNTSLFNYQSVIMPPSSIKWHIPESKS